MSKTGKSVTNKTNSTNATNSTVNQTSGSTFVIPGECHADAQSIMDQLKEVGIVSKTTRSEISPLLQGKIVQIIDEKGQIRYVYVQIISLGSKPQVTLLTDENKKLVVSSDDFKKAFKGIVLKINSGQKPETVMGKIIGIQKKGIENERNDTQIAKDDAEFHAILNGVLIGVGFVLVVVGIIIAVYFGRQLISAVNEQAARVDSFRATVDDPAAWARDRGANPVEFYTDEFAVNQGRTAFSAGFAAGYGFNQIMIILATMGITVTFEATLEMWAHAACQNWIKVISCVVGVIIALFGLVLMGIAITSIIYCIMYIGDTKEALEGIEAKSSDLNNWLNKSEVIPETLNSSINPWENKTILINSSIQNYGQNRTLSV